MPKESREQKRRRAAEVFDRLAAEMPDARIELDFRTPLELLVAVILSAQCTDKRVNLVTPALFRRYPDARAYAEADLGELEGHIKTCGLYRSKAKNLIAAGRALVQDHGGQVPHGRDALERLPGVGRKTAGVVCINLGGDAAFPVDTHIKRLAKRLGFTRHHDPDKVEADLSALLPPDRWTLGHQLLIWHGRRTCFARSPACERCGVADLCPKLGVKKPGAAAAGMKKPARRPASEGADSKGADSGEEAAEDVTARRARPRGRS
ncbi:MAG TPA: endonuclease III [Myxococcaceae bacterium]|nr:endonuclease III [Myxococcaceae bacterium]